MSTFEPALKVLSMILPDTTFFILVRTKAPPLPGFTCWNSMTFQSCPSIERTTPLRMSAVDAMCQVFRFVVCASAGVKARREILSRTSLDDCAGRLFADLLVGGEEQRLVGGLHHSGLADLVEHDEAQLPLAGLLVALHRGQQLVERAGAVRRGEPERFEDPAVAVHRLVAQATGEPRELGREHHADRHRGAVAPLVALGVF